MQSNTFLQIPCYFLMLLIATGILNVLSIRPASRQEFKCAEIFANLYPLLYNNREADGGMILPALACKLKWARLPTELILN